MNRSERWVGRHRQVDEISLADDDVRAIELAAAKARRRDLALIAGNFVPVALGFVMALAMLSGNPWALALPPVGRTLALALATFLCTLPLGAIAEAIDPVLYGRRAPLTSVAVMFGAAAGVVALWSAHPSRRAMALASAQFVSWLVTCWIGFHSSVRRRALGLASRGLAERLRRDAAARIAFEMEIPGANNGWNRRADDEAVEEYEPPFEPVLSIASVDRERESMWVLPQSSVLLRVGDQRVVERLRMVKLAVIHAPDETEDAPSNDRNDERGADDLALPTRTLTPGEVEELRSHVARETRSFGYRTLFIACWCWFTGRFIEMHLSHSDVPIATPRAILLAVVGFAAYLWFRVPPLRALRRDARERVIVRVPLDRYHGGTVAEVLRHSRRIWSQQGTPAAWRTIV